MGAAGLTPEVISGLMYSGPGSAPLVAAAAAWNGLAAELHTTAVGVESVISALTASWTGPSSMAMVGAATPYVSWLHTAAVQAEKTAIQANAAAAAFDAAFAATVPPPLIAANRAQLMVLVATNLLGQNAAAIAANEAQYAAMWAQDLAMFATYTVSSITALQMEPFSPPPKTTNEAGQVAQGANAAKDVGTMGVQQVVSRVGDPVEVTPQFAALGPGQLLGASDATKIVPYAAAPPTGNPAADFFLDFLIPDLAGLLGGIIGAVGAAASAVGIGVSAAAWVDAIPGVEENERRLNHLHEENHEMLEILGHPRPDHWRPGMWPWTEGQMGGAGSAGGLSVPPAWAAHAPEVAPAARALPMAAATPAVSGASGAAFRELALASMLGRALAGGVSPAGGPLGGVKGGKVTTVAKAAAEAAVAEAAASPAARTGIAAELRQLAQLRDEGVLTGEEFLEQKRRLLEP